MNEKGGSTKSITVRLYGPNTDYVIDRARELHVSLKLGCYIVDSWLFSIFIKENGKYLQLKILHFLFLIANLMFVRF